jgi:hypothetical protein
MIPTLDRRGLLALAAGVPLLAGGARTTSIANLGAPPPGFTSASVRVNGTSLHYVRGGQGPFVVLLHGFPEDWVEYRAIMPGWRNASPS